jgi:hypothetical protein
MARESPADKLKRMVRVTGAWEKMSPRSTFYGRTLPEFKRAIQPSHDARAEIVDLQKRLRAAIRRRDAADATSLDLVHGVVAGVRGDPEHSEDGALYAAMGYVRRSARRKRRSRKK